jgi:hypothetical protein
MFKIHEGVGKPQPSSYLFAGNHFTRLLNQDGKDAKRLARQSDADSVLAQFPRGEVYLENAKAEDTTGRERLRFCHSSLLQGLSTFFERRSPGYVTIILSKAWLVIKR